MPYEKIENTKMVSEIIDGKITIEDSGNANVFVNWPNIKPLSKEETFVELRIVNENTEMMIEFNAKQMDRLIDTLYHAQQNND